MKRTITFILALTMLLSASACGAPSEDESKPASIAETPAVEDTVPETETEAGLTKDDLPEDLDFGGETIAIHVRNGDGGDPKGNSIMEMTVEELTGEILNDAIYNRNKAVEERLNIKFVHYADYDWTQYGVALQEIRASISANEDRYDIVAGWCNSSLVSLAADGCFLDLEGVPYIDEEKPWWNQSLVKQNVFGGKRFFLTGEANILTSLGSAMAVFVNEKLAQDYQIGNLTDNVLDGTWTIDKMKEITEMVYQDLNGNGTADEADRFGLVLYNYLAADALYTSFDLHQIKIDNDGNVSYEPDAERIHTAVEKVNNLHWNTTGALGWIPHPVYREMFAQGRALMSFEFMEASREELREMGDSYYIIPTPKYDEAQEQYYSYIFNDLTVLSVPVTNQQTDAAFAVMEALSSESYFRVTPVFFNDCMQGKYARTETTIQMLELIRETCYVDYEYVYGNLFNTPAFLFRNLVIGKSSDSASWIAKNTKVIKKMIQEASEAFQD